MQALKFRVCATSNKLSLRCLLTTDFSNIHKRTNSITNYHRRIKELDGKTVTTFLSEPSFFFLDKTQPLENIVELFPAC